MVTLGLLLIALVVLNWLVSQNALPKFNYFLKYVQQPAKGLKPLWTYWRLAVLYIQLMM